MSSAGIITTFAGTGSLGYNGDGDATSSQLNYPTGVSADINGNVYIADQGNHRIRKVNSAGILSTFAGTGTAGYNGDGDATSAQLNFPTGVAADISGNVYIGDGNNHRIRKVNSAGILTTFAGTETVGYNGDGIAATSAQLWYPYGVTADINGNVYTADSSNQSIRKVNSAGIITTLAGTGIAGYSGDGVAATSAQLYFPYGVAVDMNGNVYIADTYNSRIWKVNSAGIVSTFAGGSWGGYISDGGPATSAQLNYPCGVSVDRNGNVYIADLNNNRILFVVVSSQPVARPMMLPSCQPSEQPSVQPSRQPSSQPSGNDSPFFIRYNPKYYICTLLIFSIR